MLAHIVRRIVATIPVMGIVALFVFSLLYIAPGDPAVVIAGDQASPEDIEKIRIGLGLDRPFLVRFGEWSWNILQADLGTSMFTGLPVTKLIAQRLEPTLSLMVVTLILAVTVAVPMGVISAWKAGTWIDRSLMAFAVFGFSVPVMVKTPEEVGAVIKNNPFLNEKGIDPSRPLTRITDSAGMTPSISHCVSVGVSASTSKEHRHGT